MDTGLAGLAAAGRLARRGCWVPLPEKNATPGGRRGQIIRDRHRFDMVPIILLIREIFAEIYGAPDEKVEDHLDLWRIDPTYRSGLTMVSNWL